ncbi:MAG: apolipoprotein N-acyltransferase [Fimbriimonadales bacterium]|nr:MAG: apolipoprotein N-acyltransferase [Fimbriimonadales bacterium]
MYADREYLELLLEPLRVVKEYRPKLGQTGREGISESQSFTAVGRERWGFVGLLLGSSVLSGLAHPPLGWSWLMLIAPAPLFALTLHTRARTGFAYGWLWSFVYYLTVGHPLLYLIRLQTGSLFLSVLGLVLVAGLSGLFGGLFGLAASQMPRNGLGVLGAAGVWAFTQYLRGLGPYAFVWGHWSVALYNTPALLQPASLVGAWGMEFLIAAWNGLLVMLWRLYRAQQFRVLAWALPTVIMGALIYLIVGTIALAQSAWRSRPSSDDFTRNRWIVLVQPNVDLARIYTPREWATYRLQIAEQVRQAAQQPRVSYVAQAQKSPNLIVLPEVIEPFAMPDNTPAFLFWKSLALEVQTPLLVGGYRVARAEPRQIANTMHLFLPDGRWQYHDKVQLVPLGEHVPYRQYLPWLSIFGVVEEDMYAGRDLKPMSAGDLKIGAVICMESTYPWIARVMANAGANLLVVGSNESWFGRTAALEQHLAFSVLRAIETRRWVVRCAPEGISAFISPSGEIEQRAPAFEAAVLSQVVQLTAPETLFMRWGDWMVWVGVGFALMAIGMRYLNTLTKDFGTSCR